MTLAEALRRALEWLASRGRGDAKLLHARMLPQGRVALLHWCDPPSRWEAVMLVGERVKVLWEGEHWVTPRELRLRRLRLEMMQCECGERFQVRTEDLPLEEGPPQ